MLSLKSCVSKNEKVPWRIIEGEAILVDVDKGEVIHLNEAGAEIWSSIDEEKSVDEIINHICDQFEVAKETAEKDTLEFLDQMIEKGMVECLKSP